MASSDKSEERRRHPRHPIRKTVRARVGEGTHSGATTDISAGGVAVDWHEVLADDLDEEDYLELDIEEVGYMSVQVTSSVDDGAAVRFMGIDEGDEDR